MLHLHSAHVKKRLQCSHQSGPRHDCRLAGLAGTQLGIFLTEVLLAGTFRARNLARLSQAMLFLTFTLILRDQP
ncbi:hypothetical protein BJX63DRAFT_389542 [Aspergillus granulosus]|uniref:Uncharacterized protein n=1 Tax=Aspergillus granulosus TaxID=176169 RepID=A0ABR4HKP6_9EURO